jgi:excinuclease ABC subunit C
MNDVLSEKIKSLPNQPGIYFHKDKNGEIIYVGKAAVLKNRVRQYFQNSRNMDVKTRALVSEIVDIDWIETESEIDALFLEAEMVKRYMPRFNILLRDDKSSTFVRIDMKSDFPYISFTRNPIDDSALYFGPYYNGFAVKKALRYLRKIFPYYTKQPVIVAGIHKTDLDDHLGLNPVGMNSKEYKTSLRKLIKYIRGERQSLITELERDMNRAAKNHDFETAAIMRNKISDFKELKRRIMFGDKEFLDISKDMALNDLSELLNLDKLPARIEGFDISHMGGTNVVASMVVFTNGVSNRSEYRKFKTSLDQNNDFENMREVIGRRFSDKNINSWGLPDLILVDGGKGQLDAAIRSDNLQNKPITFIGLAKRDEQIIVKSDFDINKNKLSELQGYLDLTDEFIVINLPNNTHIIKLLQRIRDESHRFAISYHTVLKRNQQKASLLDEIPGIGPKTRTKIIKKFGSVNGLKNATESEISELIGKSKAKIIAGYLKK